MSTITLGVDLAKSVFSVCAMDSAGRVIRRQDLRREPFGQWLSQQPTGTVVAMEACSGAHYWARRCIEYGLQPRIMAAQFVTPFRKSGRTKNDRADAEAIATVARQGNMRFVPVKDVDQQVRLSRHRVREGYKVESRAIGNRLRGLLAEFGVIVAPSDLALRRLIADLDAQCGRPELLGPLPDQLDSRWRLARELIRGAGDECLSDGSGAVDRDPTRAAITDYAAARRDPQLLNGSARNVSITDGYEAVNTRNKWVVGACAN